jgi:hypothetical protein
MSAEKSQSSQPSKVVQPNEYWKASTMKAKDLKKLRERGLLLDPHIYEWVETKGQAHPTPDTHQAIVFIAHFKCGFEVFSSKFLERIYRHYGIDIVHLLSNTVAMLSIFAFLCEAWLGVKLYLDLWRYFYSTTYYARNLAIGSVGFSLRTENNYITFLIKTSWKGYQRKWFYIQLYEESSIKVRALMPVTNERWRSISLSLRRCRSILHVSKEL